MYKVDINHYCTSLAYSYYNYGQVILVLVFFGGEPVSKLADRLTGNLEVFLLQSVPSSSRVGKEVTVDDSCIVFLLKFIAEVGRCILSFESTIGLFTRPCFLTLGTSVFLQIDAHNLFYVK